MAPATPTRPPTGSRPDRRLRRLRRTPALRRLVAEARLGVDDLVAPLFVREGTEEPIPIASMPGQVQHTVDSLVPEAKRLVSLGIPGLILFGVPAHKDAGGAGPGTLRASCSGLCRPCAMPWATSSSCMADLCLDEYTDHGHCGVLDPPGTSTTTRRSSSTARRPGPGRAGADVVAPSGDDGRPGGRHPRRPGRRRPRAGRRAGLRGQVRLRPLRAVPRRRRRDHRRRRGPQGLPAGPAQPAGGAGRDRSWTSPRAPTWSWSSPPWPTSTSSPPSAAVVDVPVAAYHVSGEYAMVKAARRAGLDRRCGGGPRAAHRHQAGRRRHHPHLLRRPRWPRRWVAEPDLPDVERRAVRAGPTGDPRRRGLAGALVRARSAGTPYIVARGEGALRVGRRGDALHRLRPVLRRRRCSVMPTPS